jgi:hypothetical protein
MSKFPTPAHAQANALLLEIEEAIARLDQEKTKAAAYLQKVCDDWGAALKPLKETLDAKEKELLALMKKSRLDLFPERSEIGSDRVDLPGGAVIHALAEKIRKAKSVTPEKLENLGFPEAVKIVKSVDWDKVEEFTDAQLFLIGTERKRTEDFAWEVKGAGKKVSKEI